MAIKYNRMDIFQDEIATSVRGIASQCIIELKNASIKYKTIVTELNTVFWNEPEVRYTQVCEKDTVLKDLMDKININTDGDDGFGNDNGSEFSAVSQFSLASNISLSSHRSRNSNNSLTSLNSIGSMGSMGSVGSMNSISNKSTTSMLSKLSTMSTNATPTRVKETKGAFSIVGLEHSLLSRGDSKDKSKKKSEI